MKAKVLVWSEKRKNWMPVTQRDVDRIVEMMSSSIHVIVNRKGEFLLYEPDKRSPGMWDRMKKVESSGGLETLPITTNIFRSSAMRQLRSGDARRMK